MKMKKKTIFFCIALLMMLTILSGCSQSGGRVDKAKVREELNAFIEEKMADGTFQKIYEFWYDHADTGKTFDFSKLEAKNGTIHFGTKSSKPFSFLKDNEWTGYTIEIMYRFCEEKGYGLTIEDFGNCNTIVLAASTGKCDVGGANISITEERKKSVDFSPVYYHNNVGIAIHKDNHDRYQSLEDFEGASLGSLTGSAVPEIAKKLIPNFTIQEYYTISDAALALSQKKVEFVSDDEIILHYAIREYPNLELTCPLDDRDVFGFVYAKDDGENSFLSSFASSFRRTFIEDNRWQLILKGIGNTLLITLSSIIAGSLIGFGIFLLCKKEGKISNAITKVCQWIIDGLPAVVLLMILYYLVFGSVDINNVLASIITFSLIFASAIFTIVKNAVSGIDHSQYEVSYALGYSENQTFFKMILPQAARLLWMPYQGAVKAQIKATAIVGYIATIDITKAGDMIRSSTFDAFFPLLTVALLYFILGWLLARMVDGIRINTEPSAKKSARYLKGVITHD